MNKMKKPVICMAGARFPHYLVTLTVKNWYFHNLSPSKHLQYKVSQPV